METEGIILKATAYQDHARILTLFSKDLGLSHFFVKGLCQKKPHLLAATQPFTQVEISYRKSHSDLFSATEVHPVNTHLPLRESLSSIRAAHKLKDTLLLSQFPGKSSPLLYQLFASYLGQISLFSDPSSLYASFLLKLLKHEGLLSLRPHCSLCGKASASHLQEGESFCPLHAPTGAQGFSSHAWDTLTLLTHTTSFKSLRQLTTPPSLLEWIETYTNSSFR